MVKWKTPCTDVLSLMRVDSAYSLVEVGAPITSYDLLRIAILGRDSYLYPPTIRPKLQRSSWPGWLEESDQAGCDLSCDGRSMPLPATDLIACPSLELLSCKLLVNPAAVADVLVLNVHKNRH